MGFLELAKKNLNQLIQISEAVHAITKEKDQLGHSHDAIYTEDATADSLLSKLGLTVKGKK